MAVFELAKAMNLCFNRKKEEQRRDATGVGGWGGVGGGEPTCMKKDDHQRSAGCRGLTESVSFGDPVP